MEATAQGRTEKRFSYVVRVPSSYGFDMMNVDVKLDTSWIFQDVESGDEEQGCLLEGAAGSADMATGPLVEPLESSEQSLPATGDRHVLPESGLRSRIRELELSERRLLQKVERLNARVLRERSAALCAQEQLEVLQGELARRVREEESVARRQRWRLRRLRERLRRRDEALGRQAAALERCRRTQRHQLGLVRGQERALRAQVQRLEQDVRRLCRAAGLLLAELDAAAPGSPRGVPEEAAELRALRARAESSERGRDEAERRLSRHRATERRLRGELEELRCCIYELKLSEIGLSGQVEDLAEQNRSLREELGARAPPEREHRTAPAGGCSLDARGCVQDEFLPPPREEVPAPWRSRSQQAAARPGNAGRERASAGQPSEGPCTQSCVGAGRGPSVWAPGLETTGELPGAVAGPEQEQLTLAASSLGEQVLLLVYGCPPRQGMDGTVRPVDLACMSEQSPAASPAQESFVLMQMSTLPFWGLDGDPAILPLQLLWDVTPEEPQVQEVPDARPLLVPKATGWPCWDCHQATSCTASLCRKFPRKGPRGLEETLAEEDGVLAWKPEAQEARRAWGRKEGSLGDKCRPRPRGPEDLSLESGVRAPDGEQDEARAAAFCPWPGHGLPTPLLQWEALATKAGSEALSGRGRGGACIGDLQGRHSSEKEDEAPPATIPRDHGAKGPSPAGLPSFAEQGRAVRRGVKGVEVKQHPGLGNTEVPRRGSPVDQGQGGEEAKVLHPEGACPGVPEEPAVEGCKDAEVRFLAEEGASPPSPGLPGSAEGGEPASTLWAPSKGSDGYELKIDEFEKEMEACFQQISILKLGRGGHGWETSVLAGESWSFAQKRHSHENAYFKDVLASHGSDIHSAEQAEPRETAEGVRSGETKALGPGGGLPGVEPDLGETSHGPLAGPSELGLSLLSQPPGGLGRLKRRFGQLISGLKEERSKALLDNDKLRGHQERCLKKVRALERERERNVKKICSLEQEHGRLVGDVARLKREVDQYLQVVSELEDCNGKSYSKISELEEENEKLKGSLGQMEKAMSENFRQSKGEMELITLENRELKVLISELGVGYKELIKDIVLGIKDLIRGLRGENGHLLRRIRLLERGGALDASAAVGRLVPGEKHLQGEAKMTTDDKAVQVPQLSGQQEPSWQEAPGPAGGQLGASSRVESPRHRAGPTAPSLTGRDAEVSNALQEDVAGGVEEVRLGREEKRERCSVEQGQPLWSPSQGPQLQDAEASEEDLRLRVRQLGHLVLTLRCQLQDQAATGRELQAALQDQLEEFQKRQHEANLAVTPLKAKVASLVRKCQERNRLITHLLQELHRHGTVDLLLSQMAQTMVDDEALAEYTASFLPLEARETRHHLDIGSEKTAVVRAPNYLPNPEMDSVLPSSPGSEPEDEWSAQIMHLDSLKHPLPLGTTQDPGACPAEVAVASGVPAPCQQEKGGMSCPTLQADGVPPPSELLSPARILAFYKELRESICGNSQVNKSPLEL